MGNHRNLIRVPVIAVNLIGKAIFDGNFGIINIFNQKSHNYNLCSQQLKALHEYWTEE